MNDLEHFPNRRQKRWSKLGRQLHHPSSWDDSVFFGVDTMSGQDTNDKEVDMIWMRERGIFIEMIHKSRLPCKGAFIYRTCLSVDRGLVEILFSRAESLSDWSTKVLTNPTRHGRRYTDTHVHLGSNCQK